MSQPILFSMNIKVRLDKIYNQIPKSTCSPNCGECCGILFPSKAELRNIYNWCKSHNIEYKDFTKSQSDCLYREICLKGKEKSHAEKHRKVIRELLLLDEV